MSHFRCATTRRYQEHWSCERLVTTKTDNPTFLERLCPSCYVAELEDTITELQKKCWAADDLAEFYGNPLNYHLGSSVLGNQRPVKDISKTEWVDPDSGLDFSGMVGGYRARQFQKDYPKTTSAQDAR